MIRTDLVLEAHEMFAEEISGVESHREDTDGIIVTRVGITTPEGARKIGRPIGNYVTIEIQNMQTEDENLCARGAKAMCNELKSLIKIPENASVLVAGLGNRDITPDSIGPRTVGNLVVTRHITKEGSGGFSFDVRAVSAIAPGVLSVTGIETKEILLGITERIKPSLVIAVDALASRKLSRLGSTVQICDTGISPGSGVGNNRCEISEKTLGIPVIAIGVPMVVDALTLAEDVLEEASGRQKGIIGLFPENKNMVVTPNDVDVIAEQAAKIIADGINMALL